LQAGQPCPLFGSTSHPAGEAGQALGPGVKQSRLMALGKGSKKIGGKGGGLRGEKEALKKQIQREEKEAQNLRQNEETPCSYTN
ncbi:hypothetical protein Q2460_26280, partial [Escherichia coli]|nr:hypothetical protein [Escherichia coli]